ncbi:hypothetical protein ES705_38170 [subsurface metagenome]
MDLTRLCRVSLFMAYGLSREEILLVLNILLLIIAELVRYFAEKD